MRRVLHAVSLYFDEFFSTSFGSMSIGSMSWGGTVTHMRIQG